MVEDQLLVLNGDILTDIDITHFISYHKKNKACATIALARVKDPTAYGLVIADKSGRIESFLEKPSWDEVTCNTINAGIYVLSKDAINQIPEGINYSVERGLFPALLAKRKRVFGFSKPSYWMDIGAIDKYLQAHTDVMTHLIKVNINEKLHSTKFFVGKKCKLGEHIQVDGTLVCGDNSKIGDTTTFTGSVCLGKNVVIGKGTSIRNSVILDNVKIAEGVKIDQSVIGKKCRIEANSLISAGAVLGDKTILSKFSRL
jgi:mannose-1-phosphate guanylyltransferase/phosphomannomutase